MDPVEKKSLDFLTELSRVIRFMQMYNEKHPTVKQGLQKAHKLLGEVMRLQPAVSFGAAEGTLLVQNKHITEKNPAATRFATMMTSRNVSGVIMKTRRNYKRTGNFY